MNGIEIRWTKEEAQSCLKGLQLLEFALPDCLHLPTNLLQFGDFLGIAFAIAGNFGLPVFDVRFREPAELTAMPVPEASVHEDCTLPAKEHDVRLARQALAMEAEAVSQAMKQRPDYPFRAGMLRADPRHQSAAAFGCAVIHHVGTMGPVNGERNRDFRLRQPGWPTEWADEWNDELLDLLRILTLTVDAQADLADLLERVCAGELIAAADLPHPAAAERLVPPTRR